MRIISMAILSRLCNTFPERAIEWGLGAIMVSWGAMLVIVPDLFAAAAPYYSGWSSMADENTWGMVAFGAGLLRLGALYVNGAHYRTPAVRVATSFISMFIWFWVVVGLLAGPLTTGLAVYPWFIVGDAFSAYRASGDAYEATYRHKRGEVSAGQH